MPSTLRGKRPFHALHLFFSLSRGITWWVFPPVPFSFSLCFFFLTRSKTESLLRLLLFREQWKLVFFILKRETLGRIARWRRGALVRGGRFWALHSEECSDRVVSKFRLRTFLTAENRNRSLKVWENDRCMRNTGFSLFTNIRQRLTFNQRMS